MKCPSCKEELQQNTKYFVHIEQISSKCPLAHRVFDRRDIIAIEDAIGLAERAGYERAKAEKRYSQETKSASPARLSSDETRETVDELRHTN